MRFTIPCLAAAFVCITSPKVHAQTSADDAAPVVATVQRLFDAMAQHDTASQGSIATLWAPYDFHVDGKFSHCGIDAVTLVRHAGTWRIAAIVYTTQRNGCPASPLGAPRS